MIIPSTPDPWLPGLEPLYGEPLSVHPPYHTAPCYHQDHTERYQALLTALGDDLELGSYDVFILGWLAEQGTAPAAAICSLLRRARAAARREGTPTPDRARHQGLKSRTNTSPGRNAQRSPSLPRWRNTWPNSTGCASGR